MWPENRRALEIFCAVRSQGRVAAGVVGGSFMGVLHSSIELAMERKRVPARDRDRLYDDIGFIESAARKALNRRDE